VHPDSYRHEQCWHDASFISRRERQRNMRQARARRNEGQYVSEEREYDLLRDRKHDRAHPKPKGDPGRAVPLAFDAGGDFLPELGKRIPPHQAEQAHLLLENGLSSKARRQSWCGLIGRRLNCIENSDHKFLVKCRCYLRYCPECGPLCFRELFQKHVRLSAVVESLFQNKPGDHRERVLAKLDITSRNLGHMPTRTEVREFNQDMRKLFRAIERHFGISRKDYGALWCCEFGRMNTNLHAHAVYCGPWISQKVLSR
jgi:hypothetical protein